MSSTPAVTAHDTKDAVVRRAVIARPADELYAVLADPRQHHVVDGGGTVGEIVSGSAPLTKGDSFTVKMKMFGAPYRIKSKVTAATPGQVIEWRHPLGHRWRWEFAAQADGSTEVTHSFVHGASPLGPVLLRSAGKVNGKGMERSLTNLAAAPTN